MFNIIVGTDCNFALSGLKIIYMNPKIKHILFLFVFITAILVIIKIEFKSFNDNSERPDKVPKTAVWSGGVDGGYWFDFVNYNKKNKVYSIIIFEEIKGEVVLNGKFIQKGSCDKLPLDKKILKMINYFANNEIVLSNCILIKVE